tara:strand:- start:329 stop:490 length:162 start_codon:yes stop_codon:yes gene_type:complete
LENIERISVINKSRKPNEGIEGKKKKPIKKILSLSFWGYSEFKIIFLLIFIIS